MPDWKVHISFSILLLFLVLKLFSTFDIMLDPYKIILLTFLCVFSGVFPDIDKANSKIRRIISLVLSSILILALLHFKVFNNWYELPIVFLFVYFLLRFFPTPHRSVLHTNKFSIIFTTFATLLLFLLGFSYREVLLLSFTIFISYVSHLLLDGVG